MSDDDNIVRPEFGDPPVVEAFDPGPTCSHEFVALRPRSETVVCRVCRKPVSAFDILRRLARKWSSATWLDGELSERENRVAALKEEEQRLKGRIRGAKRGLERDSLIAAHFDELMQRTGAIEKHNDIYDVERWRTAFNWFSPEQSAALKDARIRAERRIEDNRRREPRRRRVKVLPGGKA
jgi:hypothetical protein